LQVLWLRNATSVLVLVAVLTQAVIGILTVLWEVPLTTALLHQGGALLVLTAALLHFVKVSRGPVPSRQ
jgi:heme A synthase